jgi:hypothetical protein
LAGQAIKQGFGWATGCLLFIIAAIIGLAVVAALGRGGPTATPVTPPSAAIATGSPPPSTIGSAAPVAPTVATGPFRFAGSGNKVSKPIDLPAGDYQLDWEAKGGKTGCFLSIDLKALGRTELSTLSAVQVVDTGERLTGQDAGTLDGGRYVLEVKGSGCTWSTAIAPIR